MNKLAATTVKQSILNSLSRFLSNLKGSIVDNCSSTSSTLPLSAYQGYLLNKRINNLEKVSLSDGNDIITADETIDTVGTNISTVCDGAMIEVPTGLYLIIATAQFPSVSDLCSKRVGIMCGSGSYGSTATYGKNFTCIQKIAFANVINNSASFWVTVQAAYEFSGVVTNIKAVRLKLYS